MIDLGKDRITILRWNWCFYFDADLGSSDCDSSFAGEDFLLALESEIHWKDQVTLEFSFLHSVRSRIQLFLFRRWQCDLVNYKKKKERRKKEKEIILRRHCPWWKLFISLDSSIAQNENLLLKACQQMLQYGTVKKLCF